VDKLKLKSFVDFSTLELEEFPIHTIWSNVLHSHHAADAAADWLRSDRTDGVVYAIVLDNQIIGITGWYDLGTCDTALAAGMRWHGILPQYRGHGYSRVALALLVQSLPNEISVLYNNTNSESSCEHFLKCGFTITYAEAIRKFVIDASGYDTSLGWVVEHSVP
jgi:RimJ/RimL family protein N-acetyltransferase